MEVDKEILADPVAGSERLLSEYGDRLFNTARKMCCNEADAEDLTFKTLERVVLKIGTYKGNSSFFSWMCSILVNFIRMDARRKIPNALEFCEDVPETADVCPTPAEWAEKTDEACLLRAIIRNLPLEFREVLVLFYYDGMSIGEIVGALDISEGTVFSRLHRARERIRRELLRLGRDLHSFAS